MRLATHFGVIGNDIGKTIDYCHAFNIKYLCSGHWTDDLSGFKEQFAKEGITLAMMELGWVREDMIFGDAPKKNELQNFYDKIKRIGNAGIEMGHLFCALKSSGTQNLYQEWDRIIKFYLELAEHAEKNNVKIASHVGWSPEYIIRDRITFKQLFDAVPNKYIGINMCLGCLQIVSPLDITQDLNKTLDVLGDRLFMIHIRDIKVEEGNKWVDVHMGQGEINLPHIINLVTSAIEQNKIDPIVLPEHMPKVVSEQANEIASAYAIGYVNGMIRQCEWLKVKG